MLGDDMRYNTNDWNIYTIGTSDRSYFGRSSTGAARQSYGGSTQRVCVVDVAVSEQRDWYGCAGCENDSAAPRFCTAVQYVYLPVG